jgi:hypothetical protein
LSGGRREYLYHKRGYILLGIAPTKLTVIVGSVMYTLAPMLVLTEERCSVVINFACMRPWLNKDPYPATDTSLFEWMDGWMDEWRSAEGECLVRSGSITNPDLIDLI